MQKHILREQTFVYGKLLIGSKLCAGLQICDSIHASHDDQVYNWSIWMPSYKRANHKVTMGVPMMY